MTDEEEAEIPGQTTASSLCPRCQNLLLVTLDPKTDEITSAYCSVCKTNPFGIPKVKATKGRPRKRKRRPPA